MLAEECTVVCQANVVKHLLSAPMLKGRMGKWMLAIPEFDLRYESAEAVKEQVLADLIVDHGPSESVVEPVVTVV